MMRAMVYDGRLRLARDYPVPMPGPDEALIKVRMAGICNTDLEIMKGYMGYQGVLGHEFVGMVEQCAEPGWTGLRVVGEINCFCGECPACRAGRVTHCPQRTTLGIWGRDGALAEYCVLPVRNLHRVPDSVTDVQAVFVEPLAAALEILEQVHIKPTQRVIVLGDGKLGLLVAQALRLTGCDLLAIGHHTAKLKVIARLGVATQLASEAVAPGADVVVDCTGQEEGFWLARRLVRPQGTCVLKSTFHGQNLVNLSEMVVDEITLVGSRCGPFAPALRLLAGKLVDVESLVSSEFALNDGITALEGAAAKGVMKVLVRI